MLLGTAPVLMYAAGSDVRAFQMQMDRQFAFITGESRIQSIDYDITKGIKVSIYPFVCWENLNT